MHVEHTLDAPVAPTRLFEEVADLERYRRWMPLVHEVVAVPPDRSGPAWEVELRAAVGPLARSKRLRMVRTRYEPTTRAVFTRREDDGREHAPWVLTTEIDTIDGRSRLTMTLEYGGRLWAGAVLQGVLDRAVRDGSAALLELVTEETQR
ncbi:MAG: SRPBCC family protein [Actinomycetota bacterium]